MATQPLIGEREYFPGIGTIPFAGPESDDPLTFKYYQPDRMVAGKSMAEHFHFAMAYWHSLCGTGGDPFGPGTQARPWLAGTDAMQVACQKLDAAFEFVTKIGIDYYCFHDRDLAPEGRTVAESESFLQEMVQRARRKQDQSGVRLLWGTANLFSHPRYMNGAGTNPELACLAHAAAQIKAAIDATIALEGKNYVFWGGREGYFTLLNTDMRRELDHLAMLLRLARDYGRAKGFTGTFLIEPKPMEPTKHQYDFDAATVLGFLQRYDLSADFKLNLENNHATLAGHDFAHELQVAADAGMLGSIDANQGDPRNGWDTDEFLTDLAQAVRAMLVILPAGGLGHGGFNFDAKTRRSSTDLEDLFVAHISSMDTLARGLLIADRILRETDYLERRRARYASFDSTDGKAFEAGRLSLGDLRDLAVRAGEPPLCSGKQELLESLINHCL